MCSLLFCFVAYLNLVEDKKFVEAYISDGRRHGIDTEKLMQLAKAEEAKNADKRNNNKDINMLIGNNNISTAQHDDDD